MKSVLAQVGDTVAIRSPVLLFMTDCRFSSGLNGSLQDNRIERYNGGARRNRYVRQRRGYSIGADGGICSRNVSLPQGCATNLRISKDLVRCLISRLSPKKITYPTPRMENRNVLVARHFLTLVAAAHVLRQNVFLEELG